MASGAAGHSGPHVPCRYGMRAPRARNLMRVGNGVGEIRGMQAGLASPESLVGSTGLEPVALAL